MVSASKRIELPFPWIMTLKNPKKCTFLGTIEIEVAFNMDTTHTTKLWGLASRQKGVDRC
jgi:hypothetical protein